MTDQPETATTLTPAVHFSIMNARVGDTVTLEFPDGARLAAALVGRGLRNPTPGLPPAYTIVNVEVAVPTEPNSTPPTAPAPPAGSYWTDLAGKVWDLSCQYLDRHHRLYRISGITEAGPVLTCIKLPGLRFALAYVEANHGPLTPIPAAVTVVSDHERDEETRRVRILLGAVNRLISRWAEADQSARADLWRELVGAAEDAGNLFESRIADLDHRAAQLPDGGLATKPCHCYPRCAAEG